MEVRGRKHLIDVTIEAREITQGIHVGGCSYCEIEYSFLRKGVVKTPLT